MNTPLTWDQLCALVSIEGPLRILEIKTKNRPAQRGLLSSLAIGARAPDRLELEIGCHTLYNTKTREWNVVGRDGFTLYNVPSASRPHRQQDGKITFNTARTTYTLYPPGGTVHNPG